MSIAA